MERKKYSKLFIIVLLYLPVIILANSKTDIYQSFITGDMNRWKLTIDQMVGNDDLSPKECLELINYYYGYVAWCISSKNKKMATEYLNAAENKLKRLERNDSFLSDVYSYKAAFLGFRIGLNKMRAPFLGPESVKYAEMALKRDENNPVAHIENGNIYFYMPEIFGGSVERALRHYLKAKELMERDMDNLSENWYYLNLLTMIAQSYHSLENDMKAREFYEIILEIEPEYSWVNNDLYPKLIKGD